MEYDISLSISEIEQDSRAEMNGKTFDVDGEITQDGIEVLLLKMPELPREKLIPGITINEVIALINVESLLNMVTQKLGKKGVEVAD